MAKEKLTIRKSLDLLQKIRYYDVDGNIVFLMDESEEINYISDICKKYEGTTKHIVKKMKMASALEAIGIINVNNPNRNTRASSETVSNSDVLRPRVKIKRHNNYKK